MTTADEQARLTKEEAERAEDMAIDELGVVLLLLEDEPGEVVALRVLSVSEVVKEEVVLPMLVCGMASADVQNKLDATCCVTSYRVWPCVSDSMQETTA
jgi:hypothetical protein